MFADFRYMVCHGVPRCTRPKALNALIELVDKDLGYLPVKLSLQKDPYFQAPDRKPFTDGSGRLELAQAIVALGKPVAVVLMNGRPLTIGWLDEHAPAILEAWFPGTEAGHAVADVLFGDYKPTGKLLAYAATKGAIVTFTKALSQLTMERGVRVNAVAPGPVWTPLIPTTMPDEKVKNFGGDSEYGRPAEPAEMAPAFVYLATDESRYVTASVMDLTGGKMLP